LFDHNLLSDSAKELFNPFKKTKNLLASILKNLETLQFELFWDDVMSKWGSRDFLIMLSGP